MNCLVDAGKIVAVLGVTPRDCVHLAIAELGDDVRFPIAVEDRDTGEFYHFVERAEPAGPPAPPDPITSGGAKKKPPMPARPIERKQA